jgi:hypothetical protein
MFFGREGKGDAEKDHDAAGDLLEGERGAEPDPFDGGSDGRGEAMDEDHGEARTDARQCLVQREVAQAETD